MKISLVLAALFGSTLAGVAFARQQDDCNVPMVNWQSRAAVLEMAEGQGWTVRRIKTDDGCYEVYGRDETGRGIEAKINPGSLAIIEIEYEEHQDDKPEGDDHGGDQTSGSGESGAD